jgi:signal recognition particle subunit SRP68
LDILRTADEKGFKLDWFQFNGGIAFPERDTSKKPVFYDIALNYVQLDMDRLQERAGIKAPEPKVTVTNVPIKAPEPAKPAVVARARAEEIQRPTTPEPTEPGRGGLSSLLGGWWGRK